MNLLDRILLTVNTIALAIVSTLIILFSAKLISFQTLWTNLNLLYGRWEGVLAGAILLIMSIKLLFSGIKFKSSSDLSTTINKGELGLLSISYKALEDIVLRVIDKIEEIKDVKVKIIKKDEGVSINIRIMLDPANIVMPELMSDLQRDIKKFIESNVGIVVEEVSIRIEKITASSVSRQRVVR